MQADREGKIVSVHVLGIYLLIVRLIISQIITMIVLTMTIQVEMMSHPLWKNYVAPL